MSTTYCTSICYSWTFSSCVEGYLFHSKTTCNFRGFPHHPSTNDFSFDLSGSSGLRRIRTLALVLLHPTIAKNPLCWKQQKKTMDSKYILNIYDSTRILAIDIRHDRGNNSWPSTFQRWKLRSEPLFSKS